MYLYLHGGVVREPTYSVKLILTNQFPLICRTTKTIEQYHRSSFTPQDEHVECETQSWYQEVSKLKAKYDSLQRTQRHLLGEDVGPLNIKELQNLEKQLEGSSAQPRQRKCLGGSCLGFGGIPTPARIWEGVDCIVGFFALSDVSEDVRVYTENENKFKIEIPQEWQVGTRDGESSGFKSITAFYPTVGNKAFYV
eukprot:XP_014627992.1 uncharacterized protein LOC100784410 [Glycine max]